MAQWETDSKSSFHVAHRQREKEWSYRNRWCWTKGFYNPVQVAVTAAVIFLLDFNCINKFRTKYHVASYFVAILSPFVADTNNSCPISSHVLIKLRFVHLLLRLLFLQHCNSLQYLFIIFYSLPAQHKCPCIHYSLIYNIIKISRYNLIWLYYKDKADDHVVSVLTFLLWLVCGCGSSANLCIDHLSSIPPSLFLWLAIVVSFCYHVGVTRCHNRDRQDTCLFVLYRRIFIAHSSFLYGIRRQHVWI